MRVVWRRGTAGAGSLNFPLIAVGMLVILALVGGGTAWMTARNSQASRAGKANYASLPEMTFTVGGEGRTVDMKLSLELDPGVDPAVTAPLIGRIADRLGDSVRRLDAQDLIGPDASERVKSVVATAAGRELRSVRVRDVVIERLVVR